MGHGRSYLTAIITGEVPRERVGAALESPNAQAPHYKRIHGFHVEREGFTMESGMLTANGKLRRDKISARFAAQIDALYREKSA